MKLDISNAKVHPVSGFLDFGDAFSPEHKSRFIRVYTDTSDAVKAMDSIGYKKSVLEAHLTLDKAFKAAFDEAQATQLARVEGKLFQKALQENGDVARAKFLAARCPERYGRESSPKEGKGGKRESPLDSLLKRMAKEGQEGT